MTKDYEYYLWRTRGNVSKAKRKLRKGNRKIAKAKQPKAIVVRNYYLYALELENNSYYVGMTAYKDAVKRYEQHVAGKGAKWTKLHKPIKILEVRNIGKCTTKTACDAENIMTREYMNKYGMYSVRGGDLCFINPTLVALHFNDNTPVKTVLYRKDGTRISRSHANVKRQDKLQKQIAEELSWIV